MTDVISCAMMGPSKAPEFSVFIVVVLAIFAAIQVSTGVWLLVIHVELSGLVPLAVGAGAGFAAWGWQRYRLGPPGTPLPAGTALVVALLALFLFGIGSFCSVLTVVGMGEYFLVDPVRGSLGFPTVALAVMLIAQLLRTTRSKTKGPG